MNAPAAILLLAALTLLAHALDLITFLRLTPHYGTTRELNPVVRTLFARGGPLTTAAVKLGVVTAASATFVMAARSGRVREAAACLAIAAAIGLVGFLSNLRALLRLRPRRESAASPS